MNFLLCDSCYGIVAHGCENFALSHHKFSLPEHERKELQCKERYLENEKVEN